MTINKTGFLGGARFIYRKLLVCSRNITLDSTASSFLRGIIRYKIELGVKGSDFNVKK